MIDLQLTSTSALFRGYVSVDSLRARKVILLASFWFFARESIGDLRHGRIFRKHHTRGKKTDWLGTPPGLPLTYVRVSNGVKQKCMAYLWYLDASLIN